MNRSELLQYLGLDPQTSDADAMAAVAQRAAELRAVGDEDSASRLTRDASALLGMGAPPPAAAAPDPSPFVQAPMPRKMLMPLAGAALGVVSALVFAAASGMLGGGDYVEQAQAAEAAGRLEQAVTLYEKALAEQEDADKTALRRVLVGLHEKKNQQGEAARYARELVSSPEAAVEDFIRLAGLEQQLANAAGAADAWQKVTSHEGATPAQRMAAAWRLGELGRFEAALAAFQALESQPELQLKALAHRVDLKAAQGKYEDADALIAAVPEVSAGDPAILSARGRLALARGQANLALDHFQKALAGDPSSPEAQVGLAETFLRMRRRDEARMLLDRAVQSNPADFDTQLAMAMFLLADGGHLGAERLDKARAGCKSVAALAPGHGMVYVCEGLTALAASNVPLATQLMEKARSASPGILKPALDLSLCYRLGGEPGRARSTLDEALPTFPGRFELQVALARAALLADDPATARSWLDQVLARQPEYAPALIVQAQMRSAEGDAAKAQALFNEILAREPANVQARYGLAELMLKKNDGSGAREQYEVILSTDPGEIPAYVRLAAMDAVDGRGQQAVDQLRKALAAGASVEDIAEDPSFESLADFSPYRALIAEYRK